jgi:PST family polysaccharide transporter
MGYSKTAFKGISWMGGLQFSLRSLTFIKFLVMAKLLTPYQIGLFGIATIAVGFLETISDFGIGTFLIQHKDNIEDFIDTAWVMTILRGITLTALLLLLAYPTAIFFKQTQAIPLILVASFIPAVKGFVNPSVAKFQKELTFHKEFFYRFCAPIVDTFFAITLLLFVHNPLVLVFSLLLSVIADTVISFFVVSPLPAIHFDKSKANEIGRFSRWIILGGATSYFATQLDTIVVGRILGTANLGIYQTAQKFTVRLMGDISDVISKVTFPIFARLRLDPPRLHQALTRTIVTLTLSLSLLTILFVVFSHQILSILGPSWLVAELPFRIFSILGLLMGPMAIITAFFLGNGKQDMTTKLIIIRTLSLAIIIIPSAKLAGTTGAALASLFSFILIYPFAFLFLRKLIK